jgi:transcription elongation factor SPT6
MVSTKKKIEAVLEFHKKNLDDIPYIVTYRRNIYEPELSPKDIWKIFELDREWNILFEMKYNLSKAFDNIKKIALSDDRADYMYIRFIENAKSITELNDMETFIDFLKEMHYNEFQNLSEEFSKNLRPNKSSQIQNFRKYNIDKFSKIFAFGAFELSANLEALANGDQNTIVSPPEPEVQPEKLAEDYICPIFDLEIKVMTAGCKFLALELFSFPFIRNYARISFKTQCTISTDPTEEGKKELDAFHPSFRVKRVRNKPIETFNNDLFLDILESEKKGWITLTVNFGDNFFKDLTEKLNHTYHSKLKTSEVDSVAHGWRVMREETIRIFVAEHCIPYFKKEVKQELKEKAENFVLNQCAVNFSKMLMNGPYRKKKKNFNMHKDEELLKEEEYPRVLSAIYDNAKNEIYVAMLDNSGETLEVCKFVNFMTKPLKLLSEGERDLKKEDEDKLKFIIQEHKPDLIVIGANDLKCKYLKEHIGSLDVEGLRGNFNLYLNSKKIKNYFSYNKYFILESDEHKIWTTYGDVTIPRISANCPKVEKLLVNLNYFFRQAICLARFKQNPLAEICQLWHEEPNKNFCLSLPLHALQRSVSPTKLLEFLESEAVKVVNSVGVDINKSCEHQHLQSVIQFVSGLGTRKAHYLIDKLSRNHTLFMRVMLATPPKILGDIVFYNCAGFLKVKRSRDSQICDFNPLDVTRIHPENYPLANKIALSAMDDNFKDSSSEAIKIILKDPKRINILDLDEYIKTSQEKGNKYTKFNIYFIKNEFQNPFCDERPPHKDLTSSELFYLLIGDPTFKKGQMVNATVLRVDEEHVKCRLTNDLEATIWYKDVFEDSDIRPDEEKIREMKETFKPGMVVNARVKSINEVNFKIDLTIKHSELLSVKNHMDVNRIQYNYFVLVENEDYVNVNFIKENKAHQTKYQPRNINYPYFKNYTYKSSIDTLRDKKIGAYIFRPSSKGSNFLTLSWKFYDNAYSHIEIQEEEKHLGMQIGKKLRIGSEEYGSLLEIADRYLKPCELLVKDAINSRKFKKFDSIEELENKLKEEKSNKNYTPYMFTILSEFPQYIVMGHCAKVAQVIKEFIKVKPNGLFFHNEYFPNLEDLANWFKRNYTTDYYRDYLRRVKPPQVENRKIISLADENNINFDFGAFSSHLASGSRNNLEERNSVLGSVAGSSYDRERNYQTDQKSYRDRGNKAGKPCHICKEIGHLMNECPSKLFYLKFF